MRWCLSFLLFCFLAVVHALSSSGNRLLVVLEDATQKDLFSTFWGDLEGRSALENDLGAVLMKLKLEVIAFPLNRPRMRSSRCFNMERKLTTMYSFSLRSRKVRSITGISICNQLTDNRLWSLFEP